MEGLTYVPPEPPPVPRLPRLPRLAGYLVFHRRDSRDRWRFIGPAATITEALALCDCRGDSWLCNRPEEAARYGWSDAHRT
jgi:hypothetical protein